MCLKAAKNKCILLTGQTKHRSPEPTVKTERPNFLTTPLLLINATRAASLKPITSTVATPSLNGGGNEIPDNEPCKNGGCKVVRILKYQQKLAQIFYFDMPILK